jgi:Rrf2 family protein
VANGRVTAPLRVTQRVDYALKAVLLLARSSGDFQTAQALAGHYGMSPKMLASVLWRLRSAQILESRPGWHGGFRLARPAQSISLHSVVAAVAGDESVLPESQTQTPPNLTSTGPAGDSTDLVDGFWRALDDLVQDTLNALTVADLARTPSLSVTGG